jgi:DNA helicase INO80
MENLMNLVMHMRKVCNHPDLFESRDAKIPVAFRQLQVGVVVNPHLQSCPDVRMSFDNPIEFYLPKMVYDELFLLSDRTTETFRKLLPGEDVAFSHVSKDVHFKLFNIFNAAYIHE